MGSKYQWRIGATFHEASNTVCHVYSPPTHIYFSGKHLVKMIVDKNIFNRIGIKTFRMQEEFSEAIERKIVGMDFRNIF